MIKGGSTCRMSVRTILKCTSGPPFFAFSTKRCEVPGRKGSCCLGCRLLLASLQIAVRPVRVYGLEVTQSKSIRRMNWLKIRPLTKCTARPKKMNLASVALRSTLRCARKNSHESPTLQSSKFVACFSVVVRNASCVVTCDRTPECLDAFFMTTRPVEQVENDRSAERQSESGCERAKRQHKMCGGEDT